MNRRTAKVVRAYAKRTGRHDKAVKRDWNNTPRPMRHQVRKNMKAVLAE